ncbi:MAG: hypothetical protein RLZZ535_1907 [Cyanobacteriota bacterium]
MVLRRLDELIYLKLVYKGKAIFYSALTPCRYSNELAKIRKHYAAFTKQLKCASN